MDAFEVRLTPQRIKNTRTMTQNREPVRLTMAPFSSKAVITFEDIPVTKTARRFLIIDNVIEDALFVTISCKNTQKPIKNVQFEWLDNTIPPMGESTVEISWSPAEAIACKETFFVKDHRGFKTEFHIIFKSTGGKGLAAARKPLRAKNGGGLLTVSGANKMRLKTPSPPARRTTGKRLSPLNETIYKAQKSTLNRKTPRKSPRDYHCGQDKENSSPTLFTNTRRGDGCLNASDIFNTIQFTPAEKQRANGMDYMASLPTPTLLDCRSSLAPVHANIPSLSSKKIVWSPIFDDICEESRSRLATPQFQRAHTPEIVITHHQEVQEEQHVIQSKTIVKEYFNIELPEGDARRSLFDDEAPLLHTSTETYVKDLTINEAVNQTRVLTPPPPAHRQSHVFQAPLPMRDLIAKNVENIVTTPLQKKASESMKNLSSKKCREQELLRINQGSMPNLHEIETINSIENNRYYPQVAAVAHELMAQMATGQTAHYTRYDSTSVLFQSHEIRAQSSCSNLHELPDNTGLIKTNSERILRTEDRRRNPGFTLTPAANRVKCPLMTLSPPKHMTSSTQKRSFDPAAKWSQAVRLAAIAKRDKEQRNLSTSYMAADSMHVLRMASQAPMKGDRQRRVFYDAEMHVQAAINPDPFAATTTHDPFLSATMYLDERATDKYEKQFKNWLNALVTVPVDMDSDKQGQSLDVGKIFNEVRHHKKETVAQTKESVSCKYFNRYRMPLLRRSAVELYTSERIVLPLSKLDVLIEKRQLEMRGDRNLHLDLVLQRNILELLLCFNTLWLRIGLEVVFGEELPLHSNVDIYGLTSFVLNRLFKDKYLENKYSKNFALTAKYAEQIKKYALRKILHLIVFLDAAKEQKIIKHNPCLFTRASPYKETKEVMIKVASYLIANIGDITKYMKRLGIVLVHRQTYLDEFDYAFTNLAVDLRDGIRLTKVMEIIVLRDDLTKTLRYPAVSRLQKIHNVDVALKALQEADYQIRGEITPKDIVDGHREKTLSLLWQIIYRFRAPKFNAAAAIVQRWWRVRLLHREIHYRVQVRRQERMRQAAITIQRHFRGFRCRQMIPEYVRERTIATVVVQTYLRGFVVRRRFLALKAATEVVQRWWRRNKEMHSQRKQYEALKVATVAIQTRWRANRESKVARRRFEELKASTMTIQRRWRANRARKDEMMRFNELKKVTVNIQRRFRAKQKMQIERRKFVELKMATLVIQRRFRDYRLMKRVQMDFVTVQYSVTVIQRYYRGYKAMKAERGDFLAKKSAATAIQRRFRANNEMKRQRSTYLALKRTVQFVEAKYQSKMLAKVAKMEYLRLRWATVTIQRQFQAQLAMRKAKVAYERRRGQIIQIQRYFRGYLQMKAEVAKFEEIKWAVGVIQVRYRALNEMRVRRAEYQATRAKIIQIQRWTRANKARDECRAKYLQDRSQIVNVQRRWRAKAQGRRDRSAFEEIRNATIVIQRRFRATMKMRREKENFGALRNAAIVLQRQWRARQLGIRVKREYAQQKDSIISVQRMWRATLLMRKQRVEFVTLKRATIVLQNRWRARVAMRKAVAEYQELRRFTIIVQTQWRALLEMRIERARFHRKRSSAIDIQKQVRGFLVRQEMKRQQKAAETIQMYYRLHVERKRCQGEYQRLKEAAVTIQRQWRRRCAMVRDVEAYQRTRHLIVMVQRQFRANRDMRKERAEFEELKRATLILQWRLRAVLLGRQKRAEWQQKRLVIVRMQSHCRGLLARRAYKKLWYEKMSPEAIELRKKNAAALRIQACWKGYRARRKYQTKAIKAVAQKIKASRKVKAQDRVTVKSFLGSTMHKLKLGLNVSEATKIIKTLEFYSRVIPHVLVPNCVLVARYCYTMLSQATRSEPHKYLIELCSRVALNLARYEETKKQIFLYEYLETIAHMLLRWSDKECPIFNTLCTLIYVLSQSPQHKRIIHSYMTMRDGVFILKETKKAVIRKERMLNNKQRLGVFRTASVETDLERLPALECDYGIEMKTHLYVFKSRDFAFNTILGELGIELN